MKLSILMITAMLTGASAPAAALSSQEIASRLVQVLNAPEGEKRYFGSLITLEAKDAIVPDVLRLVGHSSGLNVIWDPDVESQTVSISVKEVPWDQLLDLVLTQRSLKVKVSGNVVRIMTSEAYRKSLAAADQPEPTVLAVIPVAYSDAGELKQLLKDLR